MVNSKNRVWLNWRVMLWAILIVVSSYFLGVALYHLWTFIKSWWNAEIILYKEEILVSRGHFHHFFWLRAIGWRLIIFGVLVFFGFRTIAFLHHKAVKFSGYRFFKMFLLSVTIPSILFFSLENWYRSEEESLSRSKFLGLQLSPTSEWVQSDTADERGMNYMKNGRNYWGDTLRHVNKQGFFSTFNYDTATIDSLKKAGNKIVFIIGDSHVAGTTSTTWDKTFSQVLKKGMIKDGYVICPFGIYGTDPLDYRLCAEKFIPLLKPDLVLVSYCADNDRMDFDRIPTPHIPMWFATNLGFSLPTNLDNKYIFSNPDTLRRFYRSVCPQISTSIPLRILSKFSMSFAELYVKLKYPDRVQSISRRYVNDTCTATCRNLTEIQNVCVANNAKFSIAVVPTPGESCKNLEECEARYKDVFQDLLGAVQFYLKRDLTKNDFLNDDSHFNDSGNAKFADFLEDIILANGAKND